MIRIARPLATFGAGVICWSGFQGGTPGPIPLTPGHVRPILSLGSPVVAWAPAARFVPSIVVVPPSTLTFRETLLAKLESLSAVTAIVGTAIYPGALPMTHDLGADGPAITYSVATYGRGHVLTGSDGMATARVQFSAWSYDAAESDAITLAIWDALDRPPANPWVAGGVEITSVVQVDESDQFEPPRAGGDQWVYQIVSEYSITHRTIIS